MRRTSARLADGREIIYFDHDDSEQRVLHDSRELLPVAPASQLRHDRLVDEWVAIASHRQTRTHLPATKDCPLCPSRDGRQTEIPSPDYDVAVFENRFPALDGENGRCEVVCFTSDHDSSFAALTVAQARLVIDAWADRTGELSALPGIEQVYCFENRGEEIGVTLHHPHGQIYAYPFVTPRTRQMLTAAAARPGLFASVLDEERAGPRVVTSNEHWLAFVPVAARWPVEVRLFPNRRVPDLTALTDAERDALAELYLDVLRRMDRLYDAPLPYIAAWHQAPVRTGRDLAYLHLQLFSIRRAPGKLKYLAGTESGMGAFSNDVLPEHTAERLREVGGS